MSGVEQMAGWPLAAIFGLALVLERRRAGRRREALNRGLHELRRPLQLLALAPRPAPAEPVALAVGALAQIDRALNGGDGEEPQLVFCRELAGGAVERWRDRAVAAGGSIALRWRTGEAPLLADPVRISQALDNLIVNALEHGGPHVLVDGRAVGGRLRIAVADDGRRTRLAATDPIRVERRARRPRRHGHGLEVVRSVVAAHRGRFALQRSEQGSVAMLELPLAGAGGVLAA
jgi:signal transduction histidine kinase